MVTTYLSCYFFDHILIFMFIIFHDASSHTTRLVSNPVIRENAITKAIYRTNRFIPRTIFNAPRLVIFVAEPVIINAAALPMLIPETSHCYSNGIVPPPQA